MMFCNIGDRVVATSDIKTINGHISPGDEGIVVAINENDVRDVGIRFDRDIGGHSLFGQCTNGHGWYYMTPETELDGIRVISDQSEPYALSDEMLSFLNELSGHQAH